MSRPKTFAPLRLVGRARPSADMTRDGFLAWWSGLMLRRCGSARAVAQRFECTEQTGRNWIDGVACPTGLQVMRALGWWPDDFAGAAAGHSPHRRAA